MSVFMKKIVIFLGILLIPASLLRAGELRGKVVNAETDRPLVGANVLIPGTLRGAATDANGEFVLKSVPKDKAIVLHIRHIGFEEVSISLEPNAADAGVIRLQPVTLSLADEVVVIAERNNDAYLRTAMQSNPDGSGRILRDIPGLQAVSRAAVAYDPVIRGLKASQIEVTIDGIKIVPACNGRMDPATAYVDLAEIEAMTITKGAFRSSGLGSGLGGTINFSKMKPTYSRELSTRLSLGASYHSVFSGDREFVRGELSKGKFSLQLAASRRKGDNYQSGDGEVAYSAFNDVHYDAMLGVRLSDRQELRIAHYRSEGKDTGYPALPMDTRDHTAMLYSIDYSFAQAPVIGADLQLKLYRSEIDHTMDNLDRPTARMREMVVLGETETTGGNLSAKYQLGQGTFTAGFDVWQLFATALRSMRVTRTGMQMSSLMWPDVTIDNAALFAEYRHVLAENLVAVAGARLTSTSAEAGKPAEAFVQYHQGVALDADELYGSGFVQLAYTPAPEWDMTFGIARGVRAADHKERYSWFSPNQLDGYDYIGDPRVQPEKSVQFNLMLRKQTQNLQFKVEPYFTLLQDYIAGRVLENMQPKSMGARGVKQYANFGSATIAGIDFGLRWKVHPLFVVFSNMSWARGEDIDNDVPMPEIPPLSTLSGIRYVHPSERLTLQAEARIVARQDRISPLTGEDATDGFAVYNLHATFRAGGRFVVQAGVENIADKFYHEHLDRANIAQPGRNYYLRVVQNF